MMSLERVLSQENDVGTKAWSDREGKPWIAARRRSARTRFKVR